MSSLDWFTDSGATQAESTTDVYEKRYAKLVFNKTDVRAVYIDWDDGSDNSKENANYQWLQFDYPISSTVVEHTYTKSGTFKPIVQTVNSQGIFSKYFQNASTNSFIGPLESSSRIESIGVTDSTATAVMRLENKQVLSGIDNSLFDEYGAMDIYLTVPPTISQGDTISYAPQLDIEMEVVYGLVSGSEGFSAGGSQAVITKHFTGSTTVDAGQGVEKINDDDYKVRRITKVKFVNSKHDVNTYANLNAFNKVKLFIVTSGAALTAGGGSLTPYYPVTYVSDGCPVKLADDSRRVVNFDMSQSRAASSNNTISNYYYDNGNNWFVPSNVWAGTASTLTSVSGGSTADYSVAFTYNPRPDGLMQKGGNTDASSDYVLAIGSGSNYKWVTDTDQEPRQDQFLLDEYNRFVSQGHLLRSYAVANSNSGSSLNTYAGIYRVSPALNWVNNTAQQSIGSITQSICRNFEDQVATTAVYSQDLTASGFSNTQAGQLNLDAVNTLAYKDRNNNSRTAYEYMILTAAKKHNKIFIECSPYAKALMSNASGGTNQNEIAGLYYLHAENHKTNIANYYWKPLQFEDGTKSMVEYRDTGGDTYITTGASFSKSGFIEFDMPDDWDKVSLNDLMGKTDSGGSGQWGVAEATTYPSIPTPGDFEFTFQGSCSAATGGGTQGKTVQFLRTGADWPTGISGNSSNIGAYKYIAILNTGNVGGSATNGLGQGYFLADGFDDGYDGTNTITLQIGNNEFHGGGATTTTYGMFTGSNSYTFTIRRVNWYDVIDGASTVWSTNASGAAAGAFILNPVDANIGGKTWPNFFSFMSGSNLGSAANTGWGDTELYPIKVVLKGNKYESGNTASSPATGSGAGTVGTEVWNILPYNDTASQFVEEIDDHAYSLNSLAITSNISVGRKGNYYQAITRKGKVYIAKTGVSIEKIQFTSVALGDENDSKSDKFDRSGPSSLYGHLRKIRNIQADAVRVYWDEQQKDGTYIRFWGIVTDVSDTRAAMGPRSVVNYTFNMTVEEIAIYDGNLEMITDVYPLGGIEDVRAYS